MSASAKAVRDTACVDPDLVSRADQVGHLLRRRKKTIVTAESCTAGLIAAVLSQSGSAGEVLHGSFVAYTKANKNAALGVPERLLDEKGSVNEEVARAMAEGALMRSPADIALAVTGVLGPDPDEDCNPVGLVWFACAARDQEPHVISDNYGRQDPDKLRHRTVMAALDLLAHVASST